MAELTIRLEIDPKTRRKTLVVDYESDADALPMEHDDEHERLLKALVGQGIIAPGEDVEIRVERAKEAGVTTEEASNPADREAIDQDA